MTAVLPTRRWVVYGSLVVVTGLWYVMFVVRPFNFWLMMGLSTLFLTAIAFSVQPRLIDRNDLTLAQCALGAGSALVLYGIFWVGNHALVFFSQTIPGLVPPPGGDLAAIYANRGGLSPVWVGLLLVFPIGFGEEIYWRGLVQRYFGERLGGMRGFVVTTAIYVIVHVPTGNMVLLIAALTCGLFWGALYWRTGSIVLVLVSHMLWDPLVFVLAPIGLPGG